MDERALAAHVTEAHDDVMSAILGILKMKAPDLPTIPAYAHELLLPMEITPTYEDRLIDAMPQFRASEVAPPTVPLTVPTATSTVPPPTIPAASTVPGPPSTVPVTPPISVPSSTVSVPAPTVSVAPSSVSVTQSLPLPSFQPILNPGISFVTVNPNPIQSTASARFISTFSTPEGLSIPVYSNPPQVPQNLVGAQQVPQNLVATTVFLSNYPPNDFLRTSQFGNQPQTSGFPSSTNGAASPVSSVVSSGVSSAVLSSPPSAQAAGIQPSVVPSAAPLVVTSTVQEAAQSPVSSTVQTALPSASHNPLPPIIQLDVPSVAQPVLPSIVQLDTQAVPPSEPPSGVAPEVPVTDAPAQ